MNEQGTDTGNAQLELRRAELEEKRAQRESEGKRHQQEVELKKLEMAAASGRGLRLTAAQATVVAAGLALVSGGLGGAIQAWSSRDIEAAKSQALVDIERLKAEAAERLDRAKFETTLILKATEAPSRDEQIRNLRFFLNAGFIRDPEGKIARIDERDYPSSTLVSIGTMGSISPVRDLARAIGALETEHGAACTGWLIDASHVVTASYCSGLELKTFRLGFVSEKERGDAYRVQGIAEQNESAGFTILNVDPAAGEKYGWLSSPIRAATVGEDIIFIHHGEGREQRVTVGACFVAETSVDFPSGLTVTAPKPALKFRCRGTQGGAGAPVIARRDNAILGIGFAGEDAAKLHSPGGTDIFFALSIGVIFENSAILRQVLKPAATAAGTR
jgi:hypothetical protein